ncbi:MAG: hypothetical protein CSA81_01655 [Acidobacteria bacterium]|nr:MAG: hypothetical protein CSA81_01655 [Acidobacteriota bacterium]
MSLLEKAEILLENREEKHPENLEEARRLFIEGCEEDEGASWTALSETCFWIAEYASSDKEKEQAYAEGVEAGEKAVVFAPEWADAHLWYAANLASLGLVRGIMSSLFYLKDIEKHGNLALEIDHSYFYAAPLRLMGRYYHQCPGWPIGSGNIKKSISLLEKAVATGPELILNHLYLGEAYLAKKRKKDAKSILEKALAVPTLEHLPKYHGMTREKIEHLLAKM